MKTTIRISGQIAGNYKLRYAIGKEAVHIEQWFTDHILTFETKKAARKALWEGFKALRKERQPDDPDLFLRYFPGNKLTYDASQAYIERRNP